MPSEVYIVIWWSTMVLLSLGVILFIVACFYLYSVMLSTLTEDLTRKQRRTLDKFLITTVCCVITGLVGGFFLLFHSPPAFQKSLDRIDDYHVIVVKEKCQNEFPKGTNTCLGSCVPVATGNADWNIAVAYPGNGVLGPIQFFDCEVTLSNNKTKNYRSTHLWPLDHGDCYAMELNIRPCDLHEDDDEWAY